MQLEELERLHDEYCRHTCDNEFEIIASKDCGCLQCGKVFSARKVTSWSKGDDGLSAICPHCGFTTVVGDGSGLSLEKELFSSLHRHHVLQESEEVYRIGQMAFCTLFNEQNIEDNEHNERLYERYLKEILKKLGDPHSAILLARLYFRGLRYIKPDYDLAVQYYNHESLSADATALYELGLVYDDHNERGDKRRAFECFSKSAALGSLSASACIANYYLRGEYVKKDVKFGLNALLSIFGEMVSKVFATGTSYAEFATTAFNIGVCFYYGLGAKKNRLRALRYLLIAEYFQEKVHADSNDLSEVEKNTKEMIEDIVIHDCNITSNAILLDEDTLFDSFYEQYDSYCGKELLHCEFDADSNEVRFGFTSERPMLLIDCGNALIDASPSMEWYIAGGKFAMHPTQRKFERIEFIGQEAVEFIHDDPVFGEVKVLHIDFPSDNPKPTEEE